MVENLLGLASPWGYLVVTALAGLEAAFVGLVIPGEATMLLGGVLAFSGRASVAVMMAPRRRARSPGTPRATS